ncbi:MAG TPA: Ig domain-containing protein [Gemmatimonadales bacterium]|nr:Ig domain-containing protein [Gemmatimonadales bacterium]
MRVLHRPMRVVASGLLVMLVGACGGDDDGGPDPTPAVSVTTTTVPPGTVGTAYSTTLVAAGGTGTFAWSVVGGALPAGLALGANTGVIAGTPTTAGTSNFTVRATSGGEQADRSLALTIAPPDGSTLTVTILGAGATGAVTSAPAGINCTLTSGTVGGDCNELYDAGTPVTLTPAPGAGSTFSGWSGACSGTGLCQVTMNQATTVNATFQPIPVNITTTTLPAGTVNAAYSQSLAATGGTGTFTWSVAGGTLPAGLTLNAATGVIAGTPTTAATSNFTVQAASGGQSAQRALSIVVNPAVALANFDFGGTYTGTVTYTGGASVNYFFQLNNQITELPAGTPYTWTRTATGATAYNITITNASGCTGTLTGQLVVTASIANPLAPPPLRAQTFTISNLAGNDCGVIRAGGTGNFVTF